MTIPQTDYKTRLIALSLGITIFLWLSLEDNNVIGVTLLGWISSFSIISFGLMSRYAGLTLSSKRLLFAGFGYGAMIGAGANLSTAFLMLFKDVRHAHVFPDYPPQMILAMLERLPIWTISMACIVLSLSLMYHLFRSD